MDQPAENPELAQLDAMVGEWTTSASHPAYPGVVVDGTYAFEWLEGGRFLVGRSRTDHPDFPDSLTVLGPDEDGLAMHYFDSRGVQRVYRASMEEGVWRLWRDAAGFAQRFEGTFSEDGSTIDGLWHLSRDGSSWDADVEITFRRPE